MKSRQELIELSLRTSPLLTRAGLISLDEQSNAFTTVIGDYPVTDDPIQAINDASLELEAELPLHYALRVDGDDVVILKRHVSDDGAETLKPIEINGLENGDIDVLKSIISAQGGMFKRYGTFRFDLNLHRQGLSNCSHCGEIWKSAKDSPLRCPRCRNELPPSSTKGYRNVYGPDFDFLQFNKLKNINLSQVKNSDPLLKDDILMSCNRIYNKAETRDENARSLQNALALIGEEYDAEHLNLVRLPELNSGIIELLKESESSIMGLLHEAGFKDIWTESVRPIGNWPHTAWISFGIRQRKTADELKPLLSCMLLLDISSPRWALCLLPNVKELKKIHGQEWLYVFNPIREGMRSSLSMERGLLSIDGLPEIDVVPNSPGARMVSASIAHSVIDPEKDGPARMKRKIVKIMEAHRELV